MINLYLIASFYLAKYLGNFYIHFELNFRVKIIYVGSTVRQYYGILNSWVTLPTQMMRATRRESSRSFVGLEGRTVFY